MDTFFINRIAQLWTESSSGGLFLRVAVGLFLFFISLIALFISRKVAKNTVHRIINRTKNRYDNFLLDNNVFLNLALLVPGIVMHFFIPLVFAGYPGGEHSARTFVFVYFILAMTLIIDALLNAAQDIYKTFRVSRDIPITSFVQVFKIVLYFFGIVWAVALILNKSPLFLFSGLGALTAVLMLVFKDSILGFVAGIQLISNRMLKQGDWIEMPKYGADGDVVDIALTTVKVKNFDNTITTIPTYALIADSFKNWRGMQESTGRRIKRAILIDIGSIHFCTEEMLARFVKIRHISNYIAGKNREITEHNHQLKIDDADLVNGRCLTNIGTFRAYVSAYLRNHPQIHTQMTFMVRQLAPTENGLPLEIYVFSKDKAWVNYEAIQADIFDHLLAVLPEFGLRVFQNPSGRDLSALSKRMKNR